jgi:phosphatidylinositol alpha-1,6-mannosyltransferase
VKSRVAILALVTDAFGGRGGIAQYNRDFLGALADNPAVSLVTVMPRQAPDRAQLPERIEQTPAQPGRVGYSAKVLREALLRHVDVVFCGHLLMAPLAAIITRLKRAKFIVQAHGIEVWTRPSPAHRAAVEAADLILCVSRHTRAAVLSWAAIAPERVLVLPDTVRDVFTPGDGSSWRAALGLEDKHVLLTVGRFDSRERYKGHDRVIAAIPELVGKGYDIHYVIVGEGDDRGRLEALAGQAKVNERVHFMGSVELHCLIECYRMADLFVMPSTGEGFGVVFLEAMACGTPALGLNVAGAKDALDDGELGETASEAELASTIARLLDKPKSNPEMLAAAVCAQFGRQTFIHGARAALDRVIETTRSDREVTYCRSSLRMFL